MIITKHPNQMIRLRDCGIQVPRLHSRPTAIIDYLRPHLAPHAIQIGYNTPIGEADLRRAHTDTWIQQILADDPSNAVLTTYELLNPDGSYHRYDPTQATRPLSDIVREAMDDCAGTLAACEIAIDQGFAYFLGGGMHHAMSHTGAGFCLLNDSVIALRKLQAQGRIRQAWVIDIDAHKGDGTAEITQHDSSITTLSIHMATGWPLDTPSTINHQTNLSFLPSDIDIGVAMGEDRRYLDKLQAGLALLRATYPHPDLVLVVNGSDPYEGDTLPSAQLLQLTLSEMLTRDLMVHQFCHSLDAPQAWVMSGGYGSAVWRVHAQFLERALQPTCAVSVAPLP